MFPPISPLELQQWEAFERITGPILIHDRIEVSVGMAALAAAAPYAPANRPLKLESFMPQWDPDEESVWGSQSAESLIETIRALAEKRPDADDGNVHP